jgi:protocatechuate 3,4-dioxygenase beta subunit
LEFVMNRPLSRRSLLGTAGSVSLAALLGACAKEDTSTDVRTAQGNTASVRPSTSSSASATALLNGATTCTLAPETTQGPYYFDVDSIRSDLREDRAGVVLRLALRVQDASKGCRPISNAVVDIWHCDAEGVYSGFESASSGGDGARPDGGGGGAPPNGGGSPRGAGNAEAPATGGPGAPGAGQGGVPPPDQRDQEQGSGSSGEARPTDGKTFLRGAQVTNSGGIVQFTTVYPGWYRGRAVHVHFKVHLDKKTLVTSQLFFDESFTDRVYRSAPYSARTERDTRLDSDSVYTQADARGTPILLTVQQAGDEVLGAANVVIDEV